MRTSEQIEGDDRRPTILVVDDMKETRSLLRKMLESEGYPVEEAADGTDGLEKCTSAEIGIVLADIKMEPMDGLELTRKLGASYPHIEVILITGYSSTESVIEALRSGAFDYITKPMNLERVLHSVQMAQERLASSARQEGLVRALSELNETLRTQRESTLKKCRQFETVAAHLLPPFLLIDPSLRVTYASPELLDTLETDGEAVQNLKVTEIFPFTELLNTVRRVVRGGMEESIDIPEGRAKASYRLVPLRHGNEWVEQVVMVQKDGN